MGQVIEVEATSVGTVALFSLNRSLTGQDGHRYMGSPNEALLTPPDLLAKRLFDSDPSIDNVYILSNTVSVARETEWDEAAIESANEVIAHLFVHYEAETPEELDEETISQLRAENYNSVITRIRAHNPELWVMWVKPDEPIEPFKPGQYTTLGLGYWEPRADEAMEDFESNPSQRRKMARRSYSVSSSIVDEEGELEPPHPEEVEFYIVQVRPEEEEIPALTPRIFLKGEGDRIYMSHKFTGRYTLDGVAPDHNVIFLSTGTGEAPQNKMTAELLRNQHQGKIMNVVCVRYKADLAYLEQQAAVEKEFSNYRYLTLTTREPENIGNKVYIQDLILSGRLEEEFGAPLDPASTHFFLCGNPAMIGLPKWADDGTPQFPETLGVCQILHERGHKIDHRKERGNVHYEEYWKER